MMQCSLITQTIFFHLYACAYYLVGGESVDQICQAFIDSHQHLVVTNHIAELIQECNQCNIQSLTTKLLK